MVSTRSQNSTKPSIHAAARVLVTLRATPSYTQITTDSSKFMSLWSTWYHAFLSEATDENPSYPIADRRSQATSRWVTFTSKKLHCSDSDVRAWLRTADQKALLDACA